MEALHPGHPWGGLLDTNPDNFARHNGLWWTMWERSTIPTRISCSIRNTGRVIKTEDFDSSLSLVTATLLEWSQYSSAHASTFKDMYERWLEAADPGINDLFVRAERFMEFLHIDVVIEPIYPEFEDQTTDAGSEDAAEQYVTDPSDVQPTDSADFQAKWDLKVRQTSGTPYMSHRQDTNTGERICTWYYPSAFHLVLDALHVWVSDPELYKVILNHYLAQGDPHPQTTLNRIPLEGAVLVAQTGDMWSFPIDPSLVSQT